MRFHDIANEALSAVSDRLRAALEATRVPLSRDHIERIEQLEDRLVGLRYTIESVNDAIDALLRMEDE